MKEHLFRERRDLRTPAIRLFWHRTKTFSSLTSFSLDPIVFIYQITLIVPTNVAFLTAGVDSIKSCTLMALCDVPLLCRPPLRPQHYADKTLISHCQSSSHYIYTFHIFYTQDKQI